MGLDRGTKCVLYFRETDLIYTALSLLLRANWFEINCHLQLNHHSLIISNIEADSSFISLNSSAIIQSKAVNIHI